jgi:hypothetical protein
MSYCVQVKTTGNRRNKMAADLIPSPQNNIVIFLLVRMRELKLLLLVTTAIRIRAFAQLLPGDPLFFTSINST